MQYFLLSVFSGLNNTLSAILQWGHLDHSPVKSWQEAAKEDVASLLNGIDYDSPEWDERHKISLVDALRSEFSMYRDNVTWFESACRLGATMAEMAYPLHSHDAKLLIARFTFLVLYVDDFGHRFPSSMEKFQRSMLLSEQPDEPLLRSLRAHLCDIYRCWDAIPANGIVSSAIEFISGCILENNEAVCNMKISPDTESWPYFLRQKTGVSSAYAFMIFPQSSAYNVSDFIQVMGDIMIFINLTNDVLSFYKEEMAGETGTYIHNRAHVNGKSTMDTLNDASLEAVAAYCRVTSTLQSQSPASYELWKAFVPGYVACHISEPRYRLGELGFSVY